MAVWMVRDGWSSKEGFNRNRLRTFLDVMLVRFMVFQGSSEELFTDVSRRVRYMQDVQISGYRTQQRRKQTVLRHMQFMRLEKERHGYQDWLFGSSWEEKEATDVEGGHGIHAGLSYGYNYRSLSGLFRWLCHAVRLHQVG